MSLLPASLVFLVVSCLPRAVAQTGTPHIDGAQDSKVAMTGVAIGAVLLVLALVAIGVYSIERCLHGRAKSARFTALPTQPEAEPYQYLSLPRPAKSGPYGRGPFYPGPVASPPASPNPRLSYHGPVSPSPRARPVRLDTYGHGPYYPGPMPSRPTSLNSRASSYMPRSPLSSPEGQALRFQPYDGPGSLVSPPATPKVPTSVSPSRVPPIAQPIRQNSHQTLFSLISTTTSSRSAILASSSSSFLDSRPGNLSSATSMTLVS